MIESDSLIACRLIHGSLHIYSVRKIWRGLKGIGGEIQHVYREANKVADNLATMAHQMHSNVEFWNMAELPPQTQKLCFFARIGLPVYRPKCT